MQGKVYGWFYGIMLLGTVMVNFGCTSTRVLTQDEISQTNLGEYLNVGDRVKVTTDDGNVYRFNIFSIEASYLEGSGASGAIKVPYSRIEEIAIVDGGDEKIGWTMALIPLVILIVVSLSSFSIF